MIQPSRNHQRIAASTNITAAMIEPSLDQLPQAGDEEAGERGDHVARRALTGHAHLTFAEWRGRGRPGVKGYILQRMSRQSPR